MTDAADQAAAENGGWEAQAEYDIGVLMLRYLQEHPAPEGSTIAVDLRRSADDLRQAGERGLACAGRRPLRAAGDEA